jgi:SAM-dependent methyltransferase
MTDKAPQTDSGRWQEVDREAEPDSFVSYLDRAAAILRSSRLETIRVLEVVPGCSVLDVGSGAGEFLIELAAAVENVRAVGIDASTAMVDTATSRARARGVAVEFVVGDAEHLTFPDGSFNRVNCSRVLVHVEHPRAALDEMVRVLAPDGRLAIFEPDFDGLMIDSDDLAVAAAVRGTLMAGLRNPDIGRRLRRLVLDAGLEVIDVSGSVHIIPSLQVANDQFHLMEHLDRAAANRVISAEAAGTWREAIEAADAGGRFAVAPVLFHLLATKPAGWGGS